MRKILLLWGLAVTLAVPASGCGSPATTDDGPAARSSEEALSLPLVPHKSLRVAVVGAGPSGLSAADTLKSLGYTNVTVFEKDGRVGGKVYSVRSGGQVSELGAVFASPDYTKVLGLANKYGIPYEAYGAGQKIISDKGVQSAQDFLTSHFTTEQILAAIAAYAGVQALFAVDQLDGFGAAAIAPDLYMPFDKFAAKYGITPIAEAVRSVMIGFGYGYYETTPALYYMKLLPWLLKIGLPNGLVPATYYTFPTGYASIWEAVAQGLDVRLNSEVTSITRKSSFFGTTATLTINGREQQEFDVVIVSAPLNKVGSFMTLTDQEKALFAQVQSERYFVTDFTASGLPTGEADFFNTNANPAGINHVNVWANRSPVPPPAYVGYQIADRSLSANDVKDTLAGDVVSFGGNSFQPIVQKEWVDYFPHVTQEALQNGFYPQMELLQGANNTFYVGGTMSFETVEHSARYAETLVRTHLTPLY